MGGWAWGPWGFSAPPAARSWFWHGYRLLVLATCLGVAVRSVTAGLGFVTQEVLASEGAANVAAMSSVNRNDPWTSGWFVTHDTFHLLSEVASDSDGGARFDATWQSCTIAGATIAYCPPPPVWVVELRSRGGWEPYGPWTHRSWVVEVNAITGHVIDSKTLG